tara:strand:+ start:548 stop:706 length:159 start_codon:yes stop_codon:yes gene_type:complete
MKKRKLNSNNPKYYPVLNTEIPKERRELINLIDKGIRKGKRKIIKAYSIFGE